MSRRSSVLPLNATPWNAAFTAFCCGAPLEEISQIYHIPMESLLNRVAMEKWSHLRAKLPVAQTKADESAVSSRLDLVLKNREENMKIWVELREHLVDVVGKLKSGQMKLEKVFNNKGMIVRADIDPGPGDWLNIATYARTIAEGTYRAMGDIAGAERAAQDASAGAAGATPPALTIILPGAIAQPRKDRAEKVQVVDIDALTQQDTDPEASK